MIKRYLLLLFVGLITLSASAQSTEAVLKKMYARYHGTWHSNLTFNQTTLRYKPDGTQSDSSLWVEHILYPDKLRIDVMTDKPVTILFRHDSTYYVRGGKTVRSSANENELIFFLGGMYFMPFDSVKAHLAKIHLDITKFHQSTWNGKPVYVLGANTDDEKVKQVWIDADRLIMLRNINYDNNTKEEGIFEDHIALGKAWAERKCSFYINDKLFQVEKYHEITPNQTFAKDMFDVPPAAKAQ